MGSVRPRRVSVDRPDCLRTSVWYWEPGTLKIQRTDIFVVENLPILVPDLRFRTSKSLYWTFLEAGNRGKILET